MAKLNPSQIDEYFQEHLPYRNRILIAHKKICDKGPYTGDPGILQACFEASLITGRMYLNFLGISKNKNDELVKNNFRQDDVSCEDLGGDLVDITDLNDKDKKLFVDFLKMADKGAAHLTLPIKHPWNKTHQSVAFIIKLLQTHLYDRVNREFKYE